MRSPWHPPCSIYLTGTVSTANLSIATEIVAQGKRDDVELSDVREQNESVITPCHPAQLNILGILS